MTVIPFNKPFIVGKELYYVAQAVTLGNLGNNGEFTRKCCTLLETQFGIGKVLLVPSCTAALEMAAILCDLEPGDEVIMPSYTFVSTASAFVRVGAKPVFVDIREDTLNIDEDLIEAAITPQTKVICVVHYAGVACEMDRIMEIARRHNLRVVEDAAQAVNSFYKGRALGSIGDLGCYSFHETKNFICGEGGALCVNDPALVERAEIIRDKGTNRQRFFRGEVDKYTWVDLGSSYVPSELCSAFLYAQLEEMERISLRRKEIYATYQRLFRPLEKAGLLRMPVVPEGCKTNSHLFWVIFASAEVQGHVLSMLNARNIRAVFHYVPLHTSPMGHTLCEPKSLPVTDSVSRSLLRLPFFYEITQEEQQRVADAVFSAPEFCDYSMGHDAPGMRIAEMGCRNSPEANDSLSGLNLSSTVFSFESKDC
jgi:dTDP-4-amino-4,6-dideoxygalactose transaminase